jgi:hypothetical protein
VVITSLPVHVTNFPPTDPRDWAVAATIASIVAAVAGVFALLRIKRQIELAEDELRAVNEELGILKAQMLQRANLAADIQTEAVPEAWFGDRGRYKIGVMVQNNGTRGLRDYRLTVAVPAPLVFVQHPEQTPGKLAIGRTQIGDNVWQAIDVTHGPIYAADKHWALTMTIQAPSGDYDLAWFIVCEDGRFPLTGATRSSLRLVPGRIPVN